MLVSPKFKMAVEVQVNCRAYCKLLLHATKYPECAVNGLLLAEDTKETKKLKFVDTIPLFHVSIGLAPMLEIALTQVDLYCRANGLVIGGYYQANASIQENKLNHVSSIIGKKIQEHYSDAVIFIIDNTRLSFDMKDEIYDIYQFKEPNWNRISQRSVEEETLSTATILLRSQAHRQLIDFDNHLDNIRSDWRNPGINEMLGQCV